MLANLTPGYHVSPLRGCSFGSNVIGHVQVEDRSNGQPVRSFLCSLDALSEFLDLEPWRKWRVIIDVQLYVQPGQGPGSLDHIALTDFIELSDFIVLPDSIELPDFMVLPDSMVLTDFMVWVFSRGAAACESLGLQSQETGQAM